MARPRSPATSPAACRTRCSPCSPGPPSRPSARPAASCSPARGTAGERASRSALLAAAGAARHSGRPLRRSSRARRSTRTTTSGTRARPIRSSRRACVLDRPRRSPPDRPDPGAERAAAARPHEPARLLGCTSRSCTANGSRPARADALSVEDATWGVVVLVLAMLAVSIARTCTCAVAPPAARAGQGLTRPRSGAAEDARGRRSPSRSEALSVREQAGGRGRAARGADGSRTKVSPSARSAPTKSSSRHFSSGSEKPSSVASHVLERTLVDQRQPSSPCDPRGLAILRPRCSRSRTSFGVRSARAKSACQSRGRSRPYWTRAGRRSRGAPHAGARASPPSPRGRAARPRGRTAAGAEHLVGRDHHRVREVQRGLVGMGGDEARGARSRRARPG